MGFASGSSLGWKLPDTSAQTHIRASRNQGPDYREETVTRRNRERCVESVVLAMDVWVGLGAEQTLNRRCVAASRRIHERGITLCGLKLQVGLGFDQSPNSLVMSFHRSIYQSR